MAQYRVVVVGSGSAGRRHIDAVRTMLPTAEIVVVRRPDSTSPALRLASSEATVVDSIAEAVDSGVNLAIIASPAPFHADSAEGLAIAGAHLLVEKPLAASTTDASRIIDAAETAHVGLIVGYNLRCSDTTAAFVRWVRDGSIGTPDSFRFEVGQHLDQWRPHLDARQSVTARQELGGGVLLELSHEIDALRCALGDVAAVHSAELAYHGAPTDGLVETIADAEVRLASGIVGIIHLDMVSEAPLRRWTIGGPLGELTADLIAGEVTLSVRKKPTRVLWTTGPGDRDRSELRLIENLIGLQGGETPICSGLDGWSAIAVAEAIKKSAQDSSSVDVVRPPERWAQCGHGGMEEQLWG